MITKSKIIIERPVKYLYDNKLYGSSFKALTTAISDGKIHITRKYGIKSDIIKPVLFNDPGWVDNIDWTFEPLESWDTLCKERALQLKDELGKIILAFQNTPMQYNRLMKTAALDLINGRGDVKTNISKTPINCYKTFTHIFTSIFIMF